MLGNRKAIILSGSRTGHHRPQRRGAYTWHSAYLLQQGFVECVHLLGTVVFLGRQAVAIVSTLSVAQPTSVVRSRQKLLSRSPAAINKTTVVAISTVSRVLRNAVRAWLPAALRDEACSAAIPCLPVDEIAARRPAGRAAEMKSAQANASTTPSAWTLRALGRFVHVVTSHLVAASDNSTPVMPPATETSRLSINCSRIRVILRAPSALRTAISFCRAADRATIRLATLRHPISSMHVTAHSKMT